MRKWLGRLIPVLLLAAMSAAPGLAADYLDNIKEAAAAAAEKALAQDDCDPLAYLAFAAVYLHTGRLDEAKRQFEKLLELRSDDWRARYGLGLVALLQGDSSESAAQFEAARKCPGGQQEMAALDLYLDYTCGRPCSREMFEGAALPLARETAALERVESGRDDAAVALFREALNSPAPIGFAENRAPLATFDPQRPVVLPSGRLTWKPAERADVPAASGIVTLKADASRASGVEFVTFYIDDALAGMTNYEPYRFEWNTSRYTNGMHRVRMDGKNASGRVVSSKTLWVKVRNASSPQMTPNTGPVAEELAGRLWSSIRVNESRKFGYYHLGRLYLSGGDREKALEYLGYAVAYDPNYRDARPVLSGLRKAHGLWRPAVLRGPTSQKVMAITFDDGPNERTEQLLGILDALEVRATFFLVGTRAEVQPQTVKEIDRRGHQIENHSYTHPNLTTLPLERVEEELSKNAAIIHAITGKPSLFFRPPGGHGNRVTAEAADRLGLTGVYWTLLCSPYEGARSAQLADYVINNACNGAIVLMHNGEPGTMASLPRIVTELRARGYRFVTVSELLAGTGAKPPVQAPPAQ